MTVGIFGSTVNLPPKFGNNFIDADALDYRSGPEDEVIDKILALAGDRRFTLLLPYSVIRELEHTNTPSEVKRRASVLIYSMPVQLTAPELATHKNIRDLV